MPLKSLPVPSVKTFSVVFFGAESSLIAAFDNLREIHATLIRLKCLVGPTQVLKANNRGEFAFTRCDWTKHPLFNPSIQAAATEAGGI